MNKQKNFNSSQNNAITIVDKRGIQFTITGEQKKAFTQCDRFNDFKEFKALQKAPQVIAKTLKQLAKGTSYDEVKKLQEKIIDDLKACTYTSLSETTQKEWDFNTNFASSCATKDTIIRLLDFIKSGKPRTIAQNQLADIFELALYLGIPDERRIQLAQEFYHWYTMDTSESSPRISYLQQCAGPDLEFYPTMANFIQDFRRKKVENKYSENPEQWNILLREYRKKDEYELSLNQEYLKSLGFEKKLHSLEGIEKLAALFKKLSIVWISCSNHEISDFSIEALQTLFPKLKIINLENNRITRLHKNQFILKKNCHLNLNHNPISHVNDDCFTKVGTNDLYMESPNRELFKNTYLPQTLRSRISSFYASRYQGLPFILFIEFLLSFFVEKKTCSVEKLLGHIASNHAPTNKLLFDTVPLITIMALSFILLYMHNLLHELSDKPQIYISCPNGAMQFNYFSTKPIFHF